MRWLARIAWGYLLLGVFLLVSYRLGHLSPSADPSRFAGLEIAHRGAALRFPENTLGAIEGAHALGARAVEVDVMLSADGLPVVIHDPTLERTTDGEGLVREHTVAELQTLRVRAPGGEGFAPGRIPTLEEVVERVLALGMTLEIELKTEVVRTYELSMAIVALFARHELHEHAFVSSFDPRFLYYVRQLDPEIVTALALMDRPPYGPVVDFLLHRAGTADFLGVGIIEAEHSLLTDDFLEHWQGTGRVINAFTVNSERAKARFLEAGVTVTTDCPGQGC
jgi:glycerophosphoryl diester phosphodiesterase